MSHQPNILFIFTDMQRADTIAALGNPVIKTPNLDRLVKQGTAFEKCYTPSPVCVPARACLQYGRYSQANNCFDNGAMPEDQGDSFVEALGKSGYRTHGVGKMHFTPDSLALRGFQSRERQEEIVSKMNMDQDDYLQYLQGNGYQHVCDPHGVRGEMYYVPQVAQMPAEHHPTQWVGDRSIEFLKETEQKSQPWFLMSSFIHPHPPFTPPNPWHKLYRHFDMPLPICPEDGESLLTYVNHHQNRYKYRDQGIDQNLIRGMKAYYYACISFVDYQVGRMLDELERQGNLDNTLILFTSDHGEFLGDYHCFGKRSMHDASSRIPMLARYPKSFKAGQRCSSVTSLVDVAATCLAAAGVKDHGLALDGEDLAVVGRGDCQREYVYSQFQNGPEGQYMITSAEGKYIYSAPDNKEIYFNKLSDPLETRNRKGLPTEKIKKDQHQKALMKFLWERGQKAALEEVSGELCWKRYPKLEIDADPDAGLLLQDHQWADINIPGYTDH